jgi:UDP-N-acetylmuramoyl-L-alanyl-D-glutamate--2,6-diaminopimelate ligase
MTKLLKDIIYKAGIDQIVGSTNVAIDNICFDSRQVNEFSVFVAIDGSVVNGHEYINQAVEQGATAIVCEVLPEELDSKVTYVKVKNSKEALGHIASNFYEHPSQEIKLIGVTGTNGKTTVTTLLYQLFKYLGFRVGLISTIGNKNHNKDIPSTHTTPDPIQLNKLMHEMVENGCEYVFMEVSSHAVDQRRIAGLNFDVAVFTNITHDHLDYHKTFDNYIKAKKLFFDGLGSSATALVNADDFHAEVMVQNTAAEVKTFGLRSMADFKARIIENHFGGLQLNIDGHDLITQLIGSFNAYNLLAVYGVATILAQDKMEILTDITKLKSVEGRFNYIKSDNGIIAIVDYAHTPDALKNVIDTINNIRQTGEKLISVVGCGGNRDTAKRPLMAKIAAKLSDKAIFTSDNPRNEDPAAIIKDMEPGVEKDDLRKVISITDRKEAIKTAYHLAEPGDIILIAGKGHEKYQEINGVKHPFDDMAEIKNLFQI